MNTITLTSNMQESAMNVLNRECSKHRFFKEISSSAHHGKYTVISAIKNQIQKLNNNNAKDTVYVYSFPKESGNNAVTKSGSVFEIDSNIAKPICAGSASDCHKILNSYESETGNEYYGILTFSGSVTIECADY